MLLVTAALFAVGQEFLPRSDDRELAWTQHLVGNGCLRVALAFLG